MKVPDPRARGVSPRPRHRSTVLGTVMVLLLSAVGLVVVGVPSASAAGSPSATADPVSKFPRWYQDSAGNRVEPCIDALDANCVLAPSEFFDPAQPVSFPANYPDEFFYALADSEILPTQGCAGTAPGKASVRLALEGAFLNGQPVNGDQMVFGRIRVKVTSGLCPNTTYHFRHPFGTEVVTTNGAGAVPANVGTQDIGCLTPSAAAPCDYTKAGSSRVFGSATTGFLRWNPAAAPAAPTGYLGDGATLHTVVGGTNGNSFAILDSSDNDLGLSTDQFTVAGKLTGSLAATPDPADFGGQDIGTTSPAKTVTVTNLDKPAVTLGTPSIGGPDATMFATAGGTCAAGTVLGRDQSCTVLTTFAPGGPGRRNATMQVPSTGGVRSPLSVALTGSGKNVGDAPAVTLATTDPASPGVLAFGNVRVRTSATKTLRMSNTGTAPLKVDSVVLDPANAESNHYQLTGDTCSAHFVDPGQSCTVGVLFAPSVVGSHDDRLIISTNDSGSPHFFPVTGTGTGGVATVSGTVADDGFADWYRDENGTKVEQCIDPKDPNCTVLPDATFDPANPISFPGNFPGEFFYQVATSDNVATPGCNGSAPGRAFVRSALEGSFTGGDPVPGEQIVFGRIRLAVTGGLCPNTAYTFTHPYGQTQFTTNAAGALPRNAGTEDVGCFPVLPDVCDFTLPLSSRVLGGLVRWDPAVAPAAPAGYLGDAVTPHAITGSPEGTNFFRISKADGTVVGQTDQFTVMGKLRGPLEASTSDLTLDPTPVGSTSSARTVTLTNTGIAPLTINGTTVAGTDASEFTVAGADCAGKTLAVNATCSLGATFSPSAVGPRSATLSVRHTGLNDPVLVQLSGVGGAVGSAAAISFQPRTLAFPPLHVGKVSKKWTVTVSNAGGTLPLAIQNVSLGGANPGSFSILDNRCAQQVDAGASCQIDVAFTPQTAGPLNATLVVDDNAPGGTHSLPLSGTGSTTASVVSDTVDQANGFPQWYGDANGVRLGQCLDPADPGCLVLPDAGFTTAKPVSFPTNFPAEFFYALADSDVINLPGCGSQSAAGTALMRVALEGSFANGTPAAGDQTTFARLRITVRGGLCPNADYVFVTPYGPVPFTTNATGGLAANAGTENVGCAPVAPATCDFSTALGGRVAASFPRWDPAVAPAPPDGYLGTPGTLHAITGGTYVPPGSDQPVNTAAIQDLAGNVIGQTDKFLVSGRTAGPLLGDAASVDFGHQPTGQTSGNRTVIVTNVATTATTVGSVSVTGVNADQFGVVPGSTCTGSLATDKACTVQVTFSPTTGGTKNATLRVTSATGPALLVPLTGIGDATPAPAVTVTPGVLSFGTVTAPSTLTLSTSVKNTGNAPLEVGTPSVGGAAAGDYAVTSPPCGTVAAGTACTVTVRFSPSAVGARTATLSIPHNAVGGSTQVSLTGTGAGSQFTLAPTAVKFGTVTRGTTATQSVTVKNSGTISFRVSAASASTTGTATTLFTVVNGGAGCVGTVLAAGRTCTIQVRYAPTAAVTSNGTVTVAGDGTSLPASVSASLNGTGK